MRLTADAVHVWLAWPERIQDSALLKRYSTILGAEEYTRWQRIKIPRIQHEYLIAHALLRTSLSRYTPLPPSAWRFSHNQYGRPEVANPGYQQLRFNLSHTKGLVACAITCCRQIGVDVETLDRSSRVLDIADRYFSKQECADLHALPYAQQYSRFFDYWTLKESFIKAKGMGLALPLGQFSFHLGSKKINPEQTISLSLDEQLQDDLSRWAFCLYQLSAEHKLALCYELQTPAHVQIRQTVPQKSSNAFQAELLGTSHAQTLA